MKKNYNLLPKGWAELSRPPGSNSKAIDRFPILKSCMLLTAFLLMFSTTKTLAQDGETCATAISLATLTSPFTGTTVGADNDFTPTCPGWTDAPDLFYSIVVPNGYTITIGQLYNDEDYDSTHVLFYGTCANQTLIRCTDDPDAEEDYPGWEVVWENATGSSQTVYWVQDGYGESEGSFTLRWSLREPPVCNIPRTVLAALTSATTANLSWTAPLTGTAVSYEYAVTTSPTPPATGTTTIATSITGVAVQVNTYSYLHVRTNCGTDGYSTWVTYRFYSGICIPAPTSVDNQGITNVTIGSINNTTGIEEGNYGNFTSQIVNVGQGVTQPFSITFGTIATYDTKIWIDWNDNMNFDDPGEEVYSGMSAQGAPAVLAGTFTVPVTAALGNHRLRVGGVDFGPPTACWTGSWGSFEDYTINVTLPPSCFTPGTPVAQSTGVGVGNISWAAPTLGGTPVGYEYAITTTTTIPASGTAVTGTTVTGVTLNINATNYIYVRTNCGDGDYSEWVALSFYHGVCIPRPLSTSGDGITNVTFGGINNITEAEPNGYGDYSDLTANVGQSVTQPFSITFNNDYTAHNVRIWVDWNNDLDFDDEGEQVYSGAITAIETSVLTGNFTVPVTAALGEHRVRIGAVATWYTINPCYNDYTGVFEDYTINVTPPPACFTPTGPTGIATASNLANLSWVAPTLGGTPTGYEYAVTTSATPPASGTATTAITVTGYTGIQDNVYYYVHVRTNCGAAGYSEWFTSPPFKYTPGDRCDTAIDLGALISPITSDTTGASNDFTPTCPNNTSAPDLFYSIEVPNGYVLNIGQVTNQEGYDSVHVVFYGSCGSQTLIKCTDDPDTPADEWGELSSQVEWENTTGATQTVYWVQDGYSASDGEFTLQWTLTPPPACNIPRNVIATMTSLTTADFSWTVPVTGSPIGYEYAFTTSETPPATGTATTQLSFTNVTSAANAYNYIHVRTNCGPDGYSEWITFGYYSGHCIPAINYIYNDYRIVSVETTNGFTNITSSTTENTGYTNFYDTTNVSQEPGGSFNYSISVESYTTMNMWIDWNNDLDFSDEGEMVATGVNNNFGIGNITGSIAIPGTAAQGSYRIRIRTRSAWITTNPCNTYDNGSAQDFRLDITAPPTCYTPINVAGVGIASGTANLSWSAQSLGTTPVGYEYFVSASTTSPESGTPTTQTSVTGYTPITDNTWYYLHVRANCGNGDYSQWVISRPFRYLQGDTCESAVDLGTQVSPYSYSTAGAGNDYTPLCGNSNAPDLYYSIEVPNGYTLNIGLDASGYNAVHAVFYGSSCDEDDQTSIVCTDNDLDETEWENLTGGTQTVYWIQDGSGTASGTFTLSWTLTPPAACDVPRELDVDLTSLTSANISWIVPNTGSPAGYEYVITTSETPPTGAGTYTTGLSATGVTVTPNVASYLHVRSNCGDTDGNSLWVTYPFFSGYCPASNTASTAYYIGGITTTGGDTNISNTSGFGTNGYTDNTTQSVSTYAGGSFTLAATHPSGTYVYTIWIDWNNNYDFTDEGERVINTPFLPSPAAIGNYTVPMGTPVGSYRMRIRNASLGTPIPVCGAIEYGEAEDYILNVVATPTCFPPYGIEILPQGDNLANLTWSTPMLGSAPENYEYILTSSPTPPTTAGTVTDATYIFDVAYNDTVNNYLYVRSICGEGEFSAWESNAILTTGSHEFTENSVLVYKEGNGININAGTAQITGVTLYDTRGRKLYTQTNINAAQTVIDGMQIQQQVLIVEINTNKGKVSKRIIF